MGDPAIGGVVSVSCPARWTLPRNARGILSAGLTRTRLGRIVAARFLRVRVAPRWTRPAPPIELVPHVQVPLAVVHGSADPFIPIADAHALFAAANEPRRLDLIGGMRHAFDRLANPTIVDAVEWALVAKAQPVG